VCHKTFTVTKDTVLYRLQTSAEMVSRIITRLAHGCRLQAIVVTCGIREGTVVRWDAHAGIEGRAAQTHVSEPQRDLGQLPADQIRLKSGGDLVWMASACMIRTHGWLTGEVSAHRERPWVRHLVMRVRRWAARRPRVSGADG